jgi:hypothetical protein
VLLSLQLLPTTMGILIKGFGIGKIDAVIYSFNYHLTFRSNPRRASSETSSLLDLQYGVMVPEWIILVQHFAPHFRPTRDKRSTGQNGTTKQKNKALTANDGSDGSITSLYLPVHT